MTADTNLDKLIKESIGENLVKDPGKEFTFQTVKAIGNIHAATKPLISGKVIGIFLSLLTAATVILALNPSTETTLPIDFFKYLSLSSLFKNINFQINLDSTILMILVTSCILILFQLTLLKKFILR